MTTIADLKTHLEMLDRKIFGCVLIEKDFENFRKKKKEFKQSLLGDKTNCENFDDGLTQVAPKGQFKAEIEVGE